MIIKSMASRRFLANPRALDINWTLTKKCNYNCSYCRAHDNINGEFHSNEKLQVAINKIAKLKSNDMHITFSGGEPTLHPYFHTLLVLLYQTIPVISKVTVVTNLSRTPRYFARLMDEISAWRHKLQITASYHFEHADLEQFITNLKLLGSFGISIYVNFMAHPEQIAEVKRIHARLLNTAEDIPSITIQIGLIREGHGSRPDVRYTADDIAWITQNSEKRTRPLVAEVEENGQRFMAEFSSLEIVAAGRNSFKGMFCGAGINMLGISAAGHITPAVCMMGNKQYTRNIYDENSPLQLNTSPITCPHQACGCMADIPIPKISNS